MEKYSARSSVTDSPGASVVKKERAFCLRIFRRNSAIFRPDRQKKCQIYPQESKINNLCAVFPGCIQKMPVYARKTERFRAKKRRLWAQNAAWWVKTADFCSSERQPRRCGNGRSLSCLAAMRISGQARRA